MTFNRDWVLSVARRYATSMEDTGPALQQCLDEIDRLEREIAALRRGIEFACEDLRRHLKPGEFHSVADRLGRLIEGHSQDTAQIECPDCRGGGSVMNLSMPCLRCKCTGKVPMEGKS